jgi:uncharacterized membrane protein YdjX (TVP38/TMEM64 family)
MAVAGVVAFVASGAHESLSVDGVRNWVAEAGPWGPLLFVALFALTQPFGLSAHAFILASSLVWPPMVSFPLSWVGAMAATAVSYGFARYVGQDWVQARLPEKIRSYDDRLAIRGFRTVIMLRLLFFSFAPLQLMFGVSQVRFRDVMAGTAVGMLPVMAAEVFLGASAFDWLTNGL